jgi:hypothetical protein
MYERHLPLSLVLARVNDGGLSVGPQAHAPRPVRFGRTTPGSLSGHVLITIAAKAF